MEGGWATLSNLGGHMRSTTSSLSRRGRYRAALIGPALILSLGLAGCETVGAVGSVGTGVAEVVPQSKDTGVNIESLTDVIARNPNDSEAYNTRGAAYARIGNFTDAIADFTKAVQLTSIRPSSSTRRAGSGPRPSMRAG